MRGIRGRMLPRSMGTSLQQNNADLRRASSTCSRRVNSVNMSSIRITGVSRSEREMARGSSEEARSATMPADVPAASSSACIRTPLAPGSGGTSDQGVVRITQDVRCHHAHRPWRVTLAFPDANVSSDSPHRQAAGGLCGCRSHRDSARLACWLCPGSLRDSRCAAAGRWARPGRSATAHVERPHRTVPRARLGHRVRPVQVVGRRSRIPPPRADDNRRPGTRALRSTIRGA